MHKSLKVLVVKYAVGTNFKKESRNFDFGQSNGLVNWWNWPDVVVETKSYCPQYVCLIKTLA